METVRNSVGIRRWIPRSRRLTIDVLHYHRQVPTCAHDRRMHLADLVAARSGQPQRISLSLVFLKAFAQVARDFPELRQTYMRWPVPHLYQHHDSVAVMATQRSWRGEPWLFWSRFPRPDQQPLADLQAKLDEYQSLPCDQIFRQQWQLSLLPTPLRRIFWWWTLNVSGAKRAKRSGTFFLTTIAAQGAEIQHPPAFLTSNLTYGPLDDQGTCRVTLAYDHRLMDGATVAACLDRLEATLCGPLVDELNQMKSTTVVAHGSAA